MPVQHRVFVRTKCDSCVQVSEVLCLSPQSSVDADMPATEAKDVVEKMEEVPELSKEKVHRPSY